MAYEIVAGVNARVGAANAPDALHAVPREPGPLHLRSASGAARGPTAVQWMIGIFLSLLLGVFLATALWLTLNLLHHIVFGLFALVAVARAASAAATVSPAAAAAPQADEELPSYTILAPLYGEPEMAAPLLRALGRLDYPKAKLQILLLLEADDEPTLAAARFVCAKGCAEVIVCPPGRPRTKPRACNIGLQRATGELLVIYDAEDEPDPGQLREAAARFAAGPPELACLQAPLRVHHAHKVIERQFALEYAALFEIVLPALARIDAPFPLGGTSNHFKTEALRRVGGWDAHNVTEDADLGFQLARHGYRLGVLSLPTRETAPDRLYEWLPQRTRWIKGYMQTWGVHTRAPLELGLRNAAVLTLTVGLAIASAFLHGPACAWIGAQLLIWASGGGLPDVAVLDILLLGAGWIASIGVMAVGAYRARLPMSPADGLIAPLYWSLQTLAAMHALWQLALRPFHWDKTPHRPAPEPADRSAAEAISLAGAAHARDLAVEG
ncbi:MAG TPA: glycosyltransferase family 2 protein [Caulobacteraceae bacterium]|jgi:cellulose synthase/poly-beta-1,6-N-acetylglucosamine synthase-like glycosyltransferase